MANYRQTASVLIFGDAVSDVGTTLLYPLGTRREEEGKVYRYVKLNDATVAAVAGGLAYKIPTDDWVICMDASDTDAGLVAGVLQGVIANGGYGWILTKGYVSNLSKDTAKAWVKGDLLYAAHSSTSDGKAAPLAKCIATSGAAVTRLTLDRVLAAIVGKAAAAVSSTTSTGGAYIELE